MVNHRPGWISGRISHRVGRYLFFTRFPVHPYVPAPAVPSRTHQCSWENGTRVSSAILHRVPYPLALQVGSKVQLRVKVDVVSWFRIAIHIRYVRILRSYCSERRIVLIVGCRGVGGSRMASRNESAARARAWVYANNVAGWRARASDWGASQRAAQPETRMLAHIEIIAAPLNTAAPPAPNQDATSYGDGMLDELEELCQTSKTQQQK